MGIVTYRYLSKDMKIVLVYIFTAFLVEVLNAVLSYLSIPNIIVFHVYTLLEFSLLAYVFLQWQPESRVRTIIKWSIPSFFSIWLIDKLLIHSLYEFDSFVVTVESVLLVTIAMYELYDLNKDINYSIFRNPKFWVTAAVLLYFAGNLIVFSLGSFILSEKAIASIAWILFHASLNAIAYLLFVVAFICQYRLQKYGWR